MIWERLEAPCTACSRMNEDITIIRDTPTGTPGSLLDGIARWNENGARRNRFTSFAISPRDSEQDSSILRRKAGRHVSNAKANSKNGQEADAVIKPTVIDLTTASEFNDGLNARVEPQNDIARLTK